MPNADLTSLATSFVKFGGQIISKHVNDFDVSMEGIFVYKNVKAPIAMPKISAVGNPRPYAAGDDIAGNGVKYTDRILTVNQSKWDMDFDPEVYRNKYLNDGSDNPFYELALNQVAKEYLAAINDSAAYLGVYNASGTTAAAIATGWGTIIAAEITATNLVPVTTAAHTTSNAVTNAELVYDASPVWMKKVATKMYCSFAFFALYRKNYRASFGFNFDKTEQGKYMLDGTNCALTPVSWMGTSSRLIHVIDDNLCMGTDSESIGTPTSVRRNILEVRALMPIGFQIADLQAIVVNDLA